LRALFIMVERVCAARVLACFAYSATQVVGVCRVGQNHTFIGIYRVYAVLFAGKSPYIRSYTVCTGIRFWSTLGVWIYGIIIKFTHTQEVVLLLLSVCPDEYALLPTLLDLKLKCIDR